ncbi:MAG: pyrroline-5-carboxylate reductase [Halieaceae bacterium]
MSVFSVAFIGAGNMAGSIIGGLLAAGFDAASLAAADPDEGNLQRLEKQGLTRTGTDNAAIAGAADVVVLAVKPQILRAVCEDLAPVMREGQLAVSIAAGVGADSLREWLGDRPAIVRCMPNTPALLRAGASALYAHGAVSDVQRLRAEQVMTAVGILRWVKEESLLHAVTAVSGSGPAYFFLFMEAMIAEGQRMGLDAESARTLCAQTCIGAGRMLAEGDVAAAELRRRVCSPGGSTERAVAAFQGGGLEGIVRTAMRACYARSEEMGKELT